MEKPKVEQCDFSDEDLAIADRCWKAIGEEQRNANPADLQSDAYDALPISSGPGEPKIDPRP